MPDSPAGIPDVELLERLLGGSEAALGELYDRHAPLLYAVAFRLTGGSADAARVLEEAFADIVNGATTASVHGAVEAWLVAAVRTRALELVRAKGRQRMVAKAGAAAGPVEEALRQLGVAEREVIELAGNGLTEAEIARQLEESPATVRSRLRAGMEKLRATLGADPHTRA